MAQLTQRELRLVCYVIGLWLWSLLFRKKVCEFRDNLNWIAELLKLRGAASSDDVVLTYIQVG